MNREELFDKIENYLTGTLSDEERDVFELEIKNSPELSRQVMLHQNISKTFSDQKKNQLKETLDSLSKEFLVKRPAPKKLFTDRRWWYGLAAAVALIFAIIVGIVQNKTLPPEQLYAKYYQPYSGTGLYIIVRNQAPEWDSMSVSDSLLFIARQAYESGQYQKTLRLLEIAAESGQSSSMLTFFSGICYHETGQSDLALNAFESVIQTDTSNYQEHSYWYSAMIACKMGDAQTARQLLQKIEHNSGKFGDMAKEALKKLP